MNYWIEAELFPSFKAFGEYWTIPAELSPPEGRFTLLYVASGMKRGILRMADGRIAFAASGRLYEGAMVLVPHGAVFECGFAAGVAEAFAYELACPGLKLNKPRLRYAMPVGDGKAVAMRMSVALSTYDIAVLRPLSDRIFQASHSQRGGARHLQGCLFLQALLAYFIPVQERMGYFDDPANMVFKEIEAQPRAFKVREAAKRAGRTPGGVVKGFRKAYGTTPQRVKTAQSLHLAQYCIIRTNLPFRTVAARMGFSSASYFTQFVRRTTGRTPRELRAAGKWVEVSPKSSRALRAARRDSAGAGESP